MNLNHRNNHRVESAVDPFNIPPRPGAIQVNQRCVGQFPEWGHRVLSRQRAAQRQRQDHDQNNNNNNRGGDEDDIDLAQDELVTMHHVGRYLPVVEGSLVDDDEVLELLLQDQQQQQQHEEEEAAIEAAVELMHPLQSSWQGLSFDFNHQHQQRGGRGGRARAASAGSTLPPLSPPPLSPTSSSSFEQEEQRRGRRSRRSTTSRRLLGFSTHAFRRSSSRQASPSPMSRPTSPAPPPPPPLAPTASASPFQLLRKMGNSMKKRIRSKTPLRRARSHGETHNHSTTTATIIHQQDYNNDNNNNQDVMNDISSPTLLEAEAMPAQQPRVTATTTTRQVVEPQEEPRQEEEEEEELEEEEGEELILEHYAEEPVPVEPDVYNNNDTNSPRASNDNNAFRRLSLPPPPSPTPMPPPVPSDYYDTAIASSSIDAVASDVESLVMNQVMEIFPRANPSHILVQLRRGKSTRTIINQFCASTSSSNLASQNQDDHNVNFNNAATPANVGNSNEGRATRQIDNFIDNSFQQPFLNLSNNPLIRETAALFFSTSTPASSNQQQAASSNNDTTGNDNRRPSQQDIDHVQEAFPDVDQDYSKALLRQKSLSTVMQVLACQAQEMECLTESTRASSFSSSTSTLSSRSASPPLEDDLFETFLVDNDKIHQVREVVPLADVNKCNLLLRQMSINSVVATLLAEQPQQPMEQQQQQQDEQAFLPSMARSA